jgi:mannose-6-phosphate isomerase-like protein (cupin superfamily)
MEKFNLSDFIGGWFIGNFTPTLYSTNDVEVSVKRYTKGQKENAHFHKIATEFTVIVAGEVKMSNQIFKPGEIIKILPGIATDFEALSEVVTVVVKIPGASNDKYLK